MQYAVWEKFFAGRFFVAGWGLIWLETWINYFDMREWEVKAFVKSGGEAYI